jgi:acyl dehydratase
MGSGYEETEIGETHTTGGRTITEADVMNFAGVSGDFNHLHTDAERMADSPVGQRVVHGTLVFSIATGLLWQSRTEEEREDLVAFYGVDKLRFIEPVFFDDTVHVETEVVDKEERDHPLATGVIRHQIEVKNQRDDVVLAAEFLTLVQ